MKKRVLALSVFCGLSWVVLPAMADQASDMGCTLYNQGDYKNAGRYFAQSLRAQPNNPKALYYSSLCCQKLGNDMAARNGFQTIVQVFPNSPEAALAKQALGGRGPVVVSTGVGLKPAAQGGKPKAGSTVAVALSAGDASHVDIQRPTGDTNNVKTGIAAALSRIPSGLKEAVFNNGCRIRITPTILEYDPQLAAEKPRGYVHGGGYDNVPAMYKGGKNLILVAERWSWNSGPARPGTVAEYEDCLAHEFGHAFDDFLGEIEWRRSHGESYSRLTGAKWFYDAYKRETEHMTNEQRRQVDYFVQNGQAGASELFAELFASLFSAAPSARQNQLGSYFPKTRAKVSQLAHLSNFTPESINSAIPELSEKGATDEE